MNCGECRHWHKDGEKKDKAECRRHPPVIKPGGLACSSNRAWPSTYASDWCGDFDPVKDKEPTMAEMDKETDAQLYAAALYVITSMWADTMDVLQRGSLANQIVREIERRYVVRLTEATAAGEIR